MIVVGRFRELTVLHSELILCCQTTSGVVERPVKHDAAVLDVSGDLAPSLHSPSPVTKFGGMHLTELPSELFRMTNLEQLWLVDNTVGSLPSEIALLSKLELLNVRESKVDDEAVDL